MGGRGSAQWSRQPSGPVRPLSMSGKRPDRGEGGRGARGGGLVSSGGPNAGCAEGKAPPIIDHMPERGA